MFLTHLLMQINKMDSSLCIQYPSAWYHIIDTGINGGILFKKGSKILLKWIVTTCPNQGQGKKLAGGKKMGKTASELKKAGWPKEEMEKYHPWDSIYRYSKESALLSRRDRAFNISRQIVSLLKKKYGATRVVLFGSLAHNAWFTPRSDIDICAEGIPVDRFFRAESEIEAISEDFKVDLVDPQECTPELLKRIEQEGIEL